MKTKRWISFSLVPVLIGTAIAIACQATPPDSTAKADVPDASISDATTEAHRYGAGGQALPIGPAGGALIGTYPNPGIDAAALTSVVTCDAGYALNSKSTCVLLPEGGGSTGAFTAAGGDLDGSLPDAQWVAAISGEYGSGGAVPLNNGAHITAQVDSGAYIDLTAAVSPNGYGDFKAVFAQAQPIFSNHFGLIDVDTADAGGLAIGATNANGVVLSSTNFRTTISGPLTCSTLGTGIVYSSSAGAITSGMGTANQTLVENSSGTAVEWVGLNGDCTQGADGLLTCTQAQGGDLTFSTGGQIACAAAMTSCGLVQANTTSASPSALTIQASGSIAATGTGANLVLNAGTGTGGTSGTPGNVNITWGAPGGVGSEAFTKLFRGNVVYAAFGGYPGYVTSDSAMWMGPGPTLDAAHATIFSDGTNTRVNGSSSTSLDANGSAVIYVDASNNATIGITGSGTLTLAGPIITTTQLVAHTGATLNAGQHYYFLPVTMDVSGTLVNMQLVATY